MFFFSTSSFFFFSSSSQFNRQKCDAITGVDLGHLWKKRDLLPQEGEEEEQKRGEKEMGRERFFSFKDTLELLAFTWA